MNCFILYATSHNCTKRIASHIKDRCELTTRIYNVRDVHNFYDLVFDKKNDIIVFCSPTYSSEELHIDMENFLINNQEKLLNCKYTIIETGSYYGYEDFTFGAKKILSTFLKKLKCSEVFECLSLDTFPRVDTETLNIWCSKFNNYFKNV